MPGMVMQKLQPEGHRCGPPSLLSACGCGDREEGGVDARATGGRRDAFERVDGGAARSRWSIVESCFDSGIGRSLVSAGVVVWANGETLLTPVRRVAAGARESLAGFQYGRCFYCRELLDGKIGAGHVDHVYPFAAMRTGSWSGPDLNGVWNLVVACAECNLKKSSRLPTEAEVRRLIARNEAVVASPHPLRRTLQLSMRADGAPSATTEESRLAFVQAVDLLVAEGGTGHN